MIRSSNPSYKQTMIFELFFFVFFWLSVFQAFTDIALSLVLSRFPALSLSHRARSPLSLHPHRQLGSRTGTSQPHSPRTIAVAKAPLPTLLLHGRQAAPGSARFYSGRLLRKLRQPGDSARVAEPTTPAAAAQAAPVLPSCRPAIPPSRCPAILPSCRLAAWLLRRLTISPSHYLAATPSHLPTVLLSRCLAATPCGFPILSLLCQFRALRALTRDQPEPRHAATCLQPGRSKLRLPITRDNPAPSGGKIGPLYLRGHNLPCCQSPDVSPPTWWPIGPLYLRGRNFPAIANFLRAGECT